MNKSSKWVLTVVVLAVVACTCLSIICIAAAGYVIFQRQSPVVEVSPTVVHKPPVENPPDQAATPQAVPEINPLPSVTPFANDQPVSASGEETLRTLSEEEVPVNDPILLAERLKGAIDIAPTLPPAAEPLEVGDQQKFWVTDTDTDEKRQATAALRYITDQLYFWIETGVRYDEGEMRRLADTFTEEIYPTNREFFGSEWTPGVDSDPRLHVLYVSGIGSGVAGYFSSADEVPPTAFEFSNAREMFVLSADNVQLGEDYIYGVMAHEFQHMIHYYTDRNEETWVNEGFSVLAELLNDYDIGGFDYLFMLDPDLSLTFWPGNGEFSANYGASFMYLNYFLNRYGEQATKALVAHPENGMESIDIVLRELGATDPATGQALDADDVFADWGVANYLDDPNFTDGRYTYQNYPSAPKASPHEEFASCPFGPQLRTVNQYGTDYIRLTCAGKYTLSFEGAAEVPLLPTDTYSGEYAFWSNKGDESDMTLTRTFDFSAVSGPITLSYRTWFDIEEGYDYVYLLASEDGQNWEMIQAPSGTDENPNGSNFGWGYNGATGQVWVLEEVDLSKFAGKQVQIRFEYITDAAVNGQGLLIDDIAVDALDYSSDFEIDDGGWTADGFVRVTNHLPQTFRVSLILLGDAPAVIPLELDANLQGSLEFELGSGVDEAILVVGGTTRFTNQEAQYSFSVK